MGRGADAPARRPAAEVLCAPADGGRGAAAGVSRLHRHGRRPRGSPGGQMTLEPPRLAVRLLTWRLGHAWRDYVLGDLIEEFESRSEASVPAARRWFWRQTLRCLAAPPREPRHLRAAARVRVDRPSWLGTFAADLRDGFRVVLRAPSFSLAVIAVLALGIGANVGVFTIVNGVLLRPLPFEQPDRLVRLFHVPPPAAFP